MSSPTLSQLFSETIQIQGAPAPDALLSPVEGNILWVVHQCWPTSSLEIAEFLGHPAHTREEKRLLSSRITYHIKKLVEKKKLMSKRFGNALIVWPFEVEQLRQQIHWKQMKKSECV